MGSSALYKDSPPDTGRYGALIVLGHNDHIVAIGVLDSVWTAMPALDQVNGRELLRLNRFFFTGITAAYASGIKDVPTLDEIIAVGQVPLTVEQTRVAEFYLGEEVVGKSFSHPDAANSHVEGEWRWEHDREAMLHERELKDQRVEQARAAAEHRYETRLKGLTWEQVLSENPFERWDSSPPPPVSSGRVP